MDNVQLTEGTRVFSPGGKETGRVSRLVLDPATNELTHIVIRRHEPFTEETVIPFEMIRSNARDQVLLSEGIGDLDDLPSFQETYFIKVNDPEGWPASHDTTTVPTDQTAPAYYWYPPQGHPGFPAHGLGYRTWPRTETEPNMPEIIMPIEEKTNVISSDGKHVGDVDQLFLDHESEKVTHFLISQGPSFQDRKLIPASWVKSADEEVHLLVPSDVLERLPAFDL